MKYLFLMLSVLFISGCQSFNQYAYNPQDKTLDFALNQQSVLKQPLSSYSYRQTYDRCTSNSYVIKDKEYFVEHIALNSNCDWNGSPLGYFEYNYKSKLKSKSMKRLHKTSVKNYTFLTYEINQNSILNLIHIYTNYSNTFIIDYKGELFYNLLSQMKQKYSNDYSDRTRFRSDYEQSLVQMNLFYHYFQKEIEEVLEK